MIPIAIRCTRALGICLAAGLLLITTGAVGSAGSADAAIGHTYPPPDTPSTATPIESYMANEVLADVQSERAARGLSTLVVNQALMTGEQQVMNAEAEGVLPPGIDHPVATLPYQSIHDAWIESEGATTGGIVVGLMNNPGIRGSLLLPGANDQVGIGVACTPDGNAFVIINEDNVAAGVNPVPTTTSPIVTNPTGGSTCSTVPATTTLGATGWTGTGSLQTGAVGIASTPDGGGYWIASRTGAVSAHGGAVNYGSLETLGIAADKPITQLVSTADGHGYWLVASDGGIFAFGDAQFFGSMGGRTLNAPVVDLAPTADGRGYWLVASDGGIFAFGDAHFFGSMGGRTLNAPVVGIASDHTTGGYWEVASDGGIFAFGAPFFGSTGSLSLIRPVDGMTSTPSDHGYWFVASDGGIFAFGDAQFQGSMGGSPLNAPIVGMAADHGTSGYWLVGSDGGIFSFGAPFFGSN